MTQSKQKQANQDNASQSEAWLKAALESSLEAIYLLQAYYEPSTEGDEEGDEQEVVDFIIREVNPKALAQLSMEREQLIGQRICELFPVNKENGYFEQYKQVYLSSQPLTQDLYIPSEFAASGWYRQQVVPMPQGVAIYTRNITEEKQAALKLERTAEMLSRTENVAKLGSWEWEIKSDTVTWSNELFRMMNINPADGAPPFADHNLLFPPKDLARLQEAVGEAVVNGTAYEVDIAYTPRNSPVPRRCRACGYARRTGKEITHLYGSFQDVTEQWKIQKERRHLEEQLLQSQKMEALGTLAGGIAHDFNNLLQVMLPVMEISVMRLGPEHPLSPNLNRALGAGQRARELIKKILAFSRKSQAPFEAIDPKRIIELSADLLQKSISPNIQIVVNIDGELPAIQADPVQLEQVLMNLISNAAYAVDRDSGVVKISAKKVPRSQITDPGGALETTEALHISVRDNGSGIADDILSKIFDPFYTSKPTGQGTGLGLTIAHTIINNHGGIISAANNATGGARFDIYLPVQKGLSAVEKLSNPSHTDPQGRGQLMLVDDEVDILQTHVPMLENIGYTVRYFSDGQSALEDYEGQQSGYDVVITDLSMPGMSGRELTERMSKIRPTQKIIMITGLGLSDDTDFLADKKNHRLLTKPVSIRKLHQTIQDLIG